jgi:SAM-dependent methyltransferase
MGSQLPQQSRPDEFVGRWGSMTVPSLSLCCPGCSSTLHGAIHLRCPHCGRVAPTDPAGITRFSSSDRAWPDVPEAFARSVMRAQTPDDVIAALNDVAHPVPRPQQERLLDPRNGGLAVLVGARVDTSALVLGTPWTTLPRALASLGVQVVWLDWYEARLRFGRLMCGSQAVLTGHIDPAEALPFSDGVFDFVFADLDEVDRVTAYGSSKLSGRRAKRVLTELHRVLDADGVAVLGITNPYRRPRVMGTAAAAAPGRVEAVRSALRPWGEHRIRAAGFTGMRIVVPYPHRGRWRRLIPEERLPEHLARARLPTSSEGVATSLVRRAAASVGAGKWIVRDYIVLAHRRPRGGAPPRMLTESLDAFAGEPPPVVGALSDARVTVTGCRSFVKFPLSCLEQQGLIREIENTVAARATAFEPFTLPWARTEVWHGVPYSVFPLVTQPRDTASSDAWAAILTALEAQDDDCTAAFRDTALWNRLRSDRGIADVREIGAESLHDAVLDRCSDIIVPVGATHGDLHALNVLLRGSHRPLLVDWNRFEPLNPLLLDAVKAAISAHRKHTKASLAKALSDFADGAFDDPLARRAHKLLGAMTPLQAVTLVLLDRTVSYGSPRSSHRPWKLEPLQKAAGCLTRRLEEWPS